MEVWKPCPNAEKDYEVSDAGRVRRVTPNHGATPGRVLIGSLDKAGYPVCRLTCSDRVRREVKVHRLVCEAFNGPPTPEKPHVNHKDGVKTNPHRDNLEWVSPKENVAHAVSTGLMRFDHTRDERSHKARSVRRFNADGTVSDFATVKQAAANTENARSSGVSRACSGYLKTYLGLKWAYTKPKDN